LAEHDETLERVIDALKEPVEIDASVTRRVMAAIERLPTPSSVSEAEPATGFLARRWTVRFSPLGGIAAAAALAAVIVTSSLLLRPTQPGAPANVTDAAQSTEITQFVLVAPNAQSVALVGDFNDWNLSTTSLARQAGDGIWWVTVKLPPGRYRYAFVVNGTTWQSDPNAPGSEDEFGRPNSVVTIGGAS
jgi:hypothetical protein